ncbi:ABC-2 transporter permease [Virgibacillus sp. W0430]|uniref:ABC-2 transporter permease n=1 Tax=Virgibacillus sp. W0430 TaxID=3391580 RepID=UPI003F471E75
MKQHTHYTSILMYVSILLFLVVAYVIKLPPIFLFLIVFLAIVISLFIFDYTGKMNRFLISLPVPKQRIVQSRYVALLLLALFLLFYQWGVMIFTSNIFGADYYVYSWRDIVTVFCLSGLIISITLPILYYFQSVIVSISIVLILYFLGTFLMLDPLVHVLAMKNEIIFNELDPGFKRLVETYIPFQPYISLCVVTSFFLVSSVKLAEQFFLKKDF